MSKYSLQLRWLVEQTLADAKLPNIEANWHAAYDKLGLADYPIFDETYRETLNNKIVRHYWAYEIGSETSGLFRWNLRDAMFMIMPYYNQLYLSEITAKGISTWVRPMTMPRSLNISAKGCWMIPVQASMPLITPLGPSSTSQP